MTWNKGLPLATVSILASGLAVALSAPVAWAQARPAAILMPGAGGAVATDFLMRNRGRISSAGIETRVTTSPSQAAEMARAEKQKDARW